MGLKKTFQRAPFGGGSTYTCGICKKLTRDTGRGEAGCDLCAACFEAAGLENEHSDYGHPTPVVGCPTCKETHTTLSMLKAKQAVSPAAKTPKGKETPMASNVKAEVAKLIKKLVALKDKSDAEGRKIRRILRKLGHKGGVGKVGRPAKAKPAPVKKAAKKAKPAAKPAPVGPAEAQRELENG